TFAGSGSFTDPGADTWTATVDYGDVSGVQALALSGQTFNLSHVYADDGPYTVTVTVNDGTAAGQDTALVTVNNVAPQVNAGADANINEGDTFAQSGSFADPGADTWTATVDYGDGTPVQALALTGKTFNLSHAYTSAAGSPYTVTVTVTDDDTGAGSDPVIVTVLPVAGGVGTVSGKVQDSATGDNLKGVLVTTDGQTATTNKQGKYSIDNVPEGSRTLTFSMTGYVTKFMNSVTVNAGSHTRNVNTTLDPDGGPAPDPVIVPDVVGQPEADAVSTIEGFGLVASVTSQSHETIAAGSVISQNPSGGTEVAAGSTVDLVVSSGPAKGTVKGSISLTTGGKVKNANVTASTGETDMSGNGGKYTLNGVAAGAPITVTATKTANSITCYGEGTVTPVAGGTVNLNIFMSC
ncbi:MAG: PASTA domain-containing protein, partial [Proteobacteria bacterium]|nr:PASTA domain-containing protein [Pseudomonadota bacterium]